MEWAHSIAPDANIILFEANSNSYNDLFTAVKTAADYANVSVVSMSWGGGEFSGENSYDSDFATPSGHQGVTFLAATGDSGTPSEYPAFSPNVVAVGGTSLDINTTAPISPKAPGTTASGGGAAASARSNTTQLSGRQSQRNQFHDADGARRLDGRRPRHGRLRPRHYDGGWYQVGGTSLATPMWAGLVAIADQGRALDGQTTLTSAQTSVLALQPPQLRLPRHYDGEQRHLRGDAGYDLATGIGSPVANLLVSALAATRRRHRPRRASPVRRRSTSMRIRLSSFQPPTATPSPSPTLRPVPAPSTR